MLLLDYIDQLSYKFNMQLTLGCDFVHGYHIKVNSSSSKQMIFDNMMGLPKIFKNIRKKKTFFIMTTEQLLLESQVCQEVCEEICIMSNV